AAEPARASTCRSTRSSTSICPLTSPIAVRSARKDNPSRSPGPDPREMPTFKIVVAYDGTDFVGWQRQAAGVSVQGLIEEALQPIEGREVPVTGAGRTDAGVHALGQVASFTLAREIDASTVARAVNARLPPEVRVVSADLAAPAFHARFDARSKTYRYRIWNA